MKIVVGFEESDDDLKIVQYKTALRKLADEKTIIFLYFKKFRTKNYAQFPP